MNKNRALAYAALAIAFALLNVVAFAVPSDKTTVFWIAYAFSAVAFVLQIGIWAIAFKSADTLKSKFLGIPLITLGILYLIVQIVAFAIFTALPTAPDWVAVIVCAAILGIFLIGLIGTETGREAINRVEQKAEKKVLYIRSLQADVEMLASTETDAATKAALQKLAEKLRFSDPMSHDALADLEAEIADRVEELKTAENKAAILTVLDSLITERNKKAKILK